MNLSWLAPLVAVVLFSSPAAAQVRTVDGRTLKLGGTIYRLWDIDAAEKSQKCADGWPAGIEARTRLRQLIAGRTVACEPRTKDRYGRTVALCRADGQDLGVAMVSAGMAWAFPPGQRRLCRAGACSERRAHRRACPRLREALGLAGAGQKPPTGIRSSATIGECSHLLVSRNLWLPRSALEWVLLLAIASSPLGALLMVHRGLAMRADRRFLRILSWSRC
jgi:hypothetical protein